MRRPRRQMASYCSSKEGRLRNSWHFVRIASAVACVLDFLRCTNPLALWLIKCNCYATNRQFLIEFKFQSVNIARSTSKTEGGYMMCRMPFFIRALGAPFFLFGGGWFSFERPVAFALC